jgi:predicted nuclease with TOPRIM domain
MTSPTGKSIVRALLDPLPSHPPSARDVLRRRGGEVAELRVDLADLRSERDRLLAENVRLSAELAAANSEIENLKRQADLSARQRNTAKFWVGH